MSPAETRHSVNAGRKPRHPLCATLLAALLLSACGGGGTAGGNAAATDCDPADPATSAACGSLLLGITDADGDFLSYSVDVESIELDMANGRTVTTLPKSTRIDFAQYVDLTELVTVAAVPPGAYVAGRITLDYRAAEIVVEADGAAKRAVAVDANGNSFDTVTLEIRLDDRERLLVARGRASLMTLDFDLAASHRVDIEPTPAVAVAEPFIVAEIDPVDSKDIRVRGPLLDVNEDRMTYTVALRPFHARTGDFGRAGVHVTNDTEFEIDGVRYGGGDGLRALAAAGSGTPTIAQGELLVAERRFTADVVLAGSSVPGSDSDAVAGNVIARDGDTLTVRGATVIRRDAAVYFRDDVLVTIGPDTTVIKRGHDAVLDISALSVGQRVTVRGEIVRDDAQLLHIDASDGAVRMHLTQLAGLVNAVNTGQIDIALHSIDRRRAAIFDFSGTGMSPAQDADPDNYEVATGALPFDAQATGRPLLVLGFPSAFGAAPPDFEGRTLVHHADLRSVLGIGWGSAGTVAPFLSIGNDGLLLDPANPDIDVRHHVRQGPLLIDLTLLPSGTRIVPRDDGRAIHVIKSGDSLRLYRDYADFAAALGTALDGATAARSLYARGRYDADSNTFTAWKIAIHLLEP